MTKTTSPSPPFELQPIVSRINTEAENYEIGDLQYFRSRILQQRLSSKSIFRNNLIHPKYTYHVGGRSEMQFNVGWEKEYPDHIRAGLAFSLELSQSMPDIETLIPKVKHFNDYMETEAVRFSDLSMWHYAKMNNSREVMRSDNYNPTTIKSELIAEGNFIILGFQQAYESINYTHILNILDRLYPIYQYIEVSSSKATIVEIPPTSFSNKRPPQIEYTQAIYKQSKIDINLRHNLLHNLLDEELCNQYGIENIHSEQAVGLDNRVDTILEHPSGEYWYYEIKTASTAKTCIRHAIGQLLEYSLWPGNISAAKLIVVGEPHLDKQAEQYLNELNENHNLPITYKRIIVND